VDEDTERVKQARLVVYAERAQLGLPLFDEVAAAPTLTGPVMRQAM
jgi:hypothetical protein